MEDSSKINFTYTPIYDKKIVANIKKEFSRLEGKEIYILQFVSIMFKENISWFIAYVQLYNKSHLFSIVFTFILGQYYLDHAGATLYSDLQIKNVTEDLCNSLYGNPHSVGIAGGITYDNIEQIRNR